MPCPGCGTTVDSKVFRTNNVRSLPDITYTDGSPVTLASSEWDEIGAHLAALTREFMEAINDRNLSPTSRPWNTTSENFVAISEILLNQSVSRPELIEGGEFSEYQIREIAKHNGLENDLHGQIAGLRYISQMHPNWHISIVDMEVFVRKQTRCAKVYVNHEISGLETYVEGGESVVRQAIGILEFHFEENDWWLSRYRAITGPSYSYI